MIPKIQINAKELQALRDRGVKVLYPSLSRGAADIAEGMKAADGLRGQGYKKKKSEPTGPILKQALYLNGCWTYGTETMPGQLCSKSNSRQIVTIGGRPALIKNKEAREYVKTFLATMPRPATAFEGNVRLIAKVFYQDRRRDLDIALLQDCLQECGIILNDRQVIEIHAERFIDKTNPRTEFSLTAIKPTITDRPLAFR